MELLNYVGIVEQDFFFEGGRPGEVAFVRNSNLYTKVPISECRLRTGTAPLSVRWIGISKGDDDNPVYWSRRVGKEFDTEQMDGLFAGTPPFISSRI